MDPRKLRPGELIRLLNSTALGMVITRPRLDRQRARAGLRIGPGREVDLFRYLAWAFDERVAALRAPAAEFDPTAALSKQARYSRNVASVAADIGPIRPVKNPERREACRFDLEKYLVTYFPASTGLRPFSDDHRRVIARLQHVVLKGGREAKAIYRGFAKTTLAENAGLWAVSYGHRRFVSIFGATRPLASGSMESIRAEIETNDLIDEDFPEITQAIRALEGRPQRCASQTCCGARTHIEWTKTKLAFPVTPGSQAAGAVITCNGITAASRGLKHKLPDGTGQRPDLIIVDDPQTDESATKPSAVMKRLNLIRKVILRLAGHQKQIACVVNGTIIAKDDVVDQLTDPRRNPAFQSERIKMVRKWAAAHETLWLEQYSRIRNSYDQADPEDQARAHREATAFYATHRAEMDAGAEVSWEWCFDPDTEVSSLQHAYNILIDDGPEVFASECQQEPLEAAGEDEKPSLAGIENRINRLERGKVPLWATRLVGFADVQAKLLYWMVMAVSDDFTAHVVDYGTEPEQPRTYFTLREATRTLEGALQASGKQGGQEAAIWHGLEQLEQRVIGRAWAREDGPELKVERFFVDSGWETTTIYEYCRRSRLGAVIMPSKGHSVNAASRPMTEWEIKEHEKPGFHFVTTTDPAKRHVRLTKYDPFFWKTFVAGRLKALGPGALTLFGDRPDEHRMLADHLKAEFCEKTFGRGRVVWHWKQFPGQDNHLLDAVVGCYAAAALQGCRLGENRTDPPKRKQPRVNYF